MEMQSAVGQVGFFLEERLPARGAGGERWAPAVRGSPFVFWGQAGLHHVLKYRIIMTKSLLIIQLIHCNNFLLGIIVFSVSSPAMRSNSERSLPPDTPHFAAFQQQVKAVWGVNGMKWHKWREMS